MSQGQKVIKYLAIVFAACLTITILGVVLNIVVSIFGAFIPKSGESKAVKQYTEIVSSNYSNTFNNVEQIGLIAVSIMWKSLMMRVLMV